MKDNADLIKQVAALKKENATLRKQLGPTSFTEEFLNDDANKDALKFYTGTLYTSVMHNHHVIYL